MEPEIVYTWQTILPPLVAITSAFATRQVFFSLFLGIWVGAFLLAGGDASAIGEGLLRVVDTYLLLAIAPADGSTDHISVVLFTLIVGGMIGIISANGGMRGVVGWLTRFASTPGRGQGAAFGMGFIVFFDDYANTLIVGKPCAR
jgi:Na+/H+ antiporter